MYLIKMHSGISSCFAMVYCIYISIFQMYYVFFFKMHFFYRLHVYFFYLYGLLYPCFAFQCRNHYCTNEFPIQKSSAQFKKMTGEKSCHLLNFLENNYLHSCIHAINSSASSSVVAQEVAKRMSVCVASVFAQKLVETFS